MAVTTRHDTAQPDTARPDPSAAADPGATGAATPAGEPAVGRAAAFGTLAGFVAITLLFAAIGLACGVEPVGALGLGVFVGMWGGAGFGFMVAGSLTLARHADARHAG
ncbi:MAG TPA: hypothetical protein VFI47_06220 [Acidimicrobiales bacterium]|nr:hypothetical protein [Acidimicrobiales bacterium]